MGNRNTGFGELPVDQNHNPVPSGTGIQTSDATSTPKTSPLAYSNAVITITVPSNAVEMVLKPSTDMRVGEAVAMTNYYVISSGTTHAIPISRQDFVYIIRDAADGTLNFYFVLV